MRLALSRGPVSAFGVAYQAFLPNLIERGDLVEGNTKMEVSSSLAQGGGPGLAGALVQRFGAPAALGLNAASFLVSVLSVLLIKPPQTSAAPVERRAIWLEISEGLRVLLRNQSCARSSSTRPPST